MSKKIPLSKNNEDFIPKKGEAPKADLPKDGEDIRLNKFIAHCGIAARRKASEMIKQGQFQVNGEIVREPGFRIKADDVVTFEGKAINIETQKVYILLNKPKNTVTTLNDEKGRRTVMDVVAGTVKERIYPVGRLDRDTLGLLLLTNDGDLANKLSHPSHEIKKIYHVVCDKDVSKKDIDLIRKGLKLEDGLAPVDGVSHLQGQSKKEVGIEIHIGRNRIVRRIFEHLGYEVVRLDRVYYAGLTKKDLPRGRHRFLTEQEVIMLKHFI